MSNVSTSSTISVLSQIWQRLLQVPSVNPNDNFFEMGGDSALAIQLFNELDEIYGRNLPPVMIYHAPTISSLATLVEQHSAPELSPLILLKEGSTSPPLFIAPGLGGGPAEFFQLVRYVQAPNSIYGLQPKGIEGFDDPCERIEDMAEFYLEALLRFQSRGPYLLAGYSLGGLVALEMARTLVSRGQEVPLLVLIDSYPDINALRPMQFLSLFMQRSKTPDHHLRTSTADRYPTRRTAEPRGDSNLRAGVRPRTRRSLSGTEKVQAEGLPGSGKVHSRRRGDGVPCRPGRGRGHTCLAACKSRQSPGDHLGMLTTHYEELASVINRYL